MAIDYPIAAAVTSGNCGGVGCSGGREDHAAKKR